jgi:hypothetical protein
MGILDQQVMFTEATQYLVTTATPLVTPSYKVQELASGNAGIQLGTGGQCSGVVLVTTAFLAAAGAANLEFQFVSSAAELLTNPNIHWRSGAIAKASLTVNYRLPLTLPPGNNPAWLPYVGFRLVADTNDFTAGAMSAWLEPGGGPAVEVDHATGNNVFTG